MTYETIVNIGLRSRARSSSALLDAELSESIVRRTSDLSANYRLTSKRRDVC